MLAGLLLGLLFVAQEALAGTISYQVPRDAGFVGVERNGTERVGISYRGCVSGGSIQFVVFRITTSVAVNTRATFSVLREQGQTALATLRTTKPVSLRAGAPQTTEVRILFNLNNRTEKDARFRIVLNADSGEALGTSNGIDVSVPCVVAARRRLPPTTSASAGRPAECVSLTRPVLVRAGERSTVSVRLESRAERRPIFGAIVRISGPGIRIRGTTQASGVVAFRLRPRAPGTLIIQTDVCPGADRVQVLA